MGTPKYFCVETARPRDGSPSAIQECWYMLTATLTE
jgi:hypothetical protein